MREVHPKKCGQPWSCEIYPTQASPAPTPVVVILSQASVVHVMGVVNRFCFLGHLCEVFQSEESCEARRLTKPKQTCATL